MTNKQEPVLAETVYRMFLSNCASRVVLMTEYRPLVLTLEDPMQHTARGLDLARRMGFHLDYLKVDCETEVATLVMRVSGVGRKRVTREKRLRQIPGLQCMSLEKSYDDGTADSKEL